MSSDILSVTESKGLILVLLTLFIPHLHEE